MNKTFKGTKGKWELVYSGPVCIGVGVKSANRKGYTKMVLNSILPETDYEYNKEKFQIEADMQLCAVAPEMFNVLQKISEWPMTSHISEELLSTIKQLIQKATT